MRAALRSLVGSRFGLRVVGIFVLSALVPLTLASGVLLGEFSKLLAQREQRDLNGLVRGYGMGLIGRLGSADDVLQGLAAAAQRLPDDRWIDEQVGRFEWARNVRRRPFASDTRIDSHVPPMLTASQLMSLSQDEPVIDLNYDGTGHLIVSLVRRLPGGDLLEVELAPAWLWGNLPDLTDDATILLLDSADRQLVIDGHYVGHAGNADLRDAILDYKASRSRVPDVRGESRSDWVVSHWELFLNSQFHATSWQVIGFKPASSVVTGLYSARIIFPAIVVLTLLLVCLFSVRLIRRQLRPLEVLVEETRKIGRLEFSQPVSLGGNDEFADLARSFNGMSDRLRQQFSALETMSEIDRLLLRSPGLEPILDSVLPRIAGIIGCSTVSVLLNDLDAVDHGRSYDYLRSRDQRLPVRRLTTDITALRSATADVPSIEISASDLRMQTFLSPMTEAGARRFLISALRPDGENRGFLCVGYDDAPEAPANSSIQIDDFADRLSVVLANLGKAEKLYEQAHFDPLTRLPNRQHFRDMLAMRLARNVGPAMPGALLYIDLDHFKRVNDTAGHTMGDELLCAVARRLETCFEAGDFVARLGGDEFAAIVQQAGDGDAARQAAQKVLETLHAPLTLSGREYRIEASIGITLFPADGETIEDLLKNSDIAMYRAKECGRDQVVFFESEMHERMQARAALESGLHHALEREEFTLLFQPIIECSDCRMAGVEALIRWPSAPGSEPRSPSVFIPVAEESDLIIGIGEWVLRTACRQFNAWRNLGVDVGYVSVNVSARQLRHAGFVELVLDCLDVWDMKAGNLHVEITEGVLADGSSIARTLDELAGHGVHLALDDFGTGYSSLSYLRHFPIHSVKIDKSFITEIPGNPAACRLVESIIAMSTVLEKYVVAEGVETEAQLRFLQSAGCGSVQGYLLGRPKQAEEVPEFCRRIYAKSLLLSPAAPAPRAASR